MVFSIAKVYDYYYHCHYPQYYLHSFNEFHLIISIFLVKIYLLLFLLLFSIFLSLIPLLLLLLRLHYLI